MKKLTLLDILMNADTLPWDQSLYLPCDSSTWCSSTEAIIESADAFEEHDDSDNPIAITDIGYTYVLSFDDVTSISHNLKEKIKHPVSNNY